jgi:hypothetical protein
VCCTEQQEVVLIKGLAFSLRAVSIEELSLRTVASSLIYNSQKQKRIKRCSFSMLRFRIQGFQVSHRPHMEDEYLNMHLFTINFYLNYRETEMVNTVPLDCQVFHYKIFGGEGAEEGKGK